MFRYTSTPNPPFFTPPPSTPYLLVGSAVRSLSYTAIDEESGDGRGQYSLYVGCEEGDYSHLARGTSLKQIMDLVRSIIQAAVFIAHEGIVATQRRSDMRAQIPVLM